MTYLVPLGRRVLSLSCSVRYLIPATEIKLGPGVNQTARRRFHETDCNPLILKSEEVSGIRIVRVHRQHHHAVRTTWCERTVQPQSECQPLRPWIESSLTFPAWSQLEALMTL